MKRILEHLLSLLTVFLLLCSVAVWSGKLLGHPLKPVHTDTSAPAFAAPDEAQLKSLGLDAKGIGLTPGDSAWVWTVVDGAGERLGHIVSSAPFTADIEGFAGTTPLYIYVGADGRVVRSVAADNAETPDFFASAWEGTAPKWNGLPAEEGAALKVDAVSGATYSSQAIVRNMQRTLAAYAASRSNDIREPAIGWGRTAALAAVLLLGIVAAWKLRGRRWVRLGVLGLNVAVLGFWCGQFLSLSLLRGWVSGGLDPVVYLPTLLMLLVAVVLPFFGRKRHYCTWVCPYGSAQELVGRLPFPKIPCSAKVYRLMRRVRMAVLCALLLLLWSDLGLFLLDYEPFSAFLVQTAPTAVTVLASAFLVASLFVPQLWCKSCCPVGTLLDLSEEETNGENANRKTVNKPHKTAK